VRFSRPAIAILSSGLTHYSHIGILHLVLWNWKLKNPAEGAHLDNVEKKSGFLRIYDEDWFYLVTVGIEFIGAPTLSKMLRSQQLAKEILAAPSSSPAAVDEMTTLLKDISVLIFECDKVLARMHEKCDPHKFYTQVRPWVAGWKSNKALPNGLTFSGAFDNKPQEFYGGSAAQSSLIQSWDAAFGVQHKDHATQYLLAMRQYMPPKHRGLVEFLANASPSIKDAVTASGNANLTSAFNECLSAVESFRSTHINIVGRYIVAQSTKREGEEQGTGGTSIMPLLRTARQETKDNRIPDGKPQH
jgi:indoleamine 2,3-dioxygenase